MGMDVGTVAYVEAQADKLRCQATWPAPVDVAIGDTVVVRGYRSVVTTRGDLGHAFVWFDLPLDARVKSGDEVRVYPANAAPAEPAKLQAPAEVIEAAAGVRDGLEVEGLGDDADKLTALLACVEAAPAEDAKLPVPAEVIALVRESIGEARAAMDEVPLTGHVGDQRQTVDRKALAGVRLAVQAHITCVDALLAAVEAAPAPLQASAEMIEVSRRGMSTWFDLVENLIDAAVVGEQSAVSIPLMRMYRLREVLLYLLGKDAVECPTCDGRGWVEVQGADLHDPPMQDTCGECGGSGRVPAEDDEELLTEAEWEARFVEAYDAAAEAHVRNRTGLQIMPWGGISPQTHRCFRAATTGECVARTGDGLIAALRNLATAPPKAEPAPAAPDFDAMDPAAQRAWLDERGYVQESHWETGHGASLYRQGGKKLHEVMCSYHNREAALLALCEKVAAEEATR